MTPESRHVATRLRAAAAVIDRLATDFPDLSAPFAHIGTWGGHLTVLHPTAPDAAHSHRRLVREVLARTSEALDWRRRQDDAGRVSFSAFVTEPAPDSSAYQGVELVLIVEPGR